MKADPLAFLFLAEQRRIKIPAAQLIALVDPLETHLAASQATAANLLSALVAEITGTANTGKAFTRSTAKTGRRGSYTKQSKYMKPAAYSELPSP